MPLQTRSRDGRSQPHLQRTRFDVVGVHRQKLIGSDQRYWNDVHLCLDSKKEPPLLKWLDLSIGRASTLGKNHQRHSALQRLQRRTNAANRCRWILLVNAHLPRRLQMPTASIGSIRSALKTLKGGMPLVIFPEGGRT